MCEEVAYVYVVLDNPQNTSSKRKGVITDLNLLSKVWDYWCSGEQEICCKAPLHPALIFKYWARRLIADLSKNPNIRLILIGTPREESGKPGMTCMGNDYPLNIDVEYALGSYKITGQWDIAERWKG